jgi:hypothetical protein
MVSSAGALCAAVRELVKATEPEVILESRDPRVFPRPVFGKISGGVTIHKFMIFLDIQAGLELVTSGAKIAGFPPH